MFTSETEPLSNHVFRRELEEFKKHIHSLYKDNQTKTEGTKLPVEDHHMNGNIIYEVNQSMESFTSLFNNYSSLSSVDTYLDSNDLVDLVNKKPVQIAVNGDFKACLDYISKFRRKAGLSMYGALLRSVADSNVILNPFHPLTAITIASDPLLKASNYNVILYFYENRKVANSDYMSSKANINAMQENINNLIRTYNHTLDQNVDAVIQSCKLANATPYCDSYRLNLQKYDYFYNSAQEVNATYFLVTHQVLTRGIITPYYGSSFIKYTQGRGGVGKHLTPFNSVNISGNGFSNGWTSVCTGNQPHNKKGFTSLTHANLLSPYNTMSLLAGSLAYADLCINKSYEIYHSLGVIDDLTDLIWEPDVTEKSVLDTIDKDTIDMFYVDRLAFTIKLMHNYPDLDHVKVIQELTQRINHD